MVHLYRVAPVTTFDARSPAVGLPGRLLALLLPLLIACQVDKTTGISDGTLPPPAPARPDARPSPPPTVPPDAGQAAPVPVAEPAPEPPADAGAVRDAAAAEVTTGPVDGQTGTNSVDARPPGAVAGGAPCEPGGELALCLRFEGNLADQSGNGLPVRSVGPLTFAPAAEGQALDIRPGLRLAIAETPILDSEVLTVQATVRPRALGRRMGIVENLGQYALVILPSGSAMCTGGGAYALTNNAVAPERWTQLTCVYDGARVMLFVDGRQTATNPTGPIATNRVQGLRIGWEETPDRDFDGLVADVRIWRAVHRP
jgi:hypothetical protein